MNRSRWLPGRRPGIKTIAALAMAGCAAASLAAPGAGVATGSAGGPARSTGVTAGHTAPMSGSQRLREARMVLGDRPAAKSRNAFAVPGGPAVLAINHRTKTLYVMTFGKTIALVSTTHCNQQGRSGCRVRSEERRVGKEG